MPLNEYTVLSTHTHIDNDECTDWKEELFLSVFYLIG